MYFTTQSINQSTNLTNFFTETPIQALPLQTYKQNQRGLKNTLKLTNCSCKFLGKNHWEKNHFNKMDI